MPQDKIVLAIRNLGINPGCEVDGDLIAVAKDLFEDAIVEKPMANGNPALQLGRLSEMGEIIRREIEKRIHGKRLPVDANWRILLDKYLDAHRTGSTDELEGRPAKRRRPLSKSLPNPV